MLASGYTKLTVVASGNSNSVKIGLNDYSSANSKFTEIARSGAVTSGKLLAFTFDLKDTAINDYLSINVAGAEAVKLYIFEISFSK